MNSFAYVVPSTTAAVAGYLDPNTAPTKNMSLTLIERFAGTGEGLHYNRARVDWIRHCCH